MAYARIDGIGGQAIDAVSITQEHPLGFRVVARDPTYGDGEFVYVKGIIGATVGLACTFNPYTGVTALTGARAKGLVGIFMGTLIAPLFGWVQVRGSAVAKVATTVVAGSTVYLSGVAGQLDDAVVAGDIVYGANFATADATPTAGFAVAALSNPFAGDTDNA